MRIDIKPLSVNQCYKGRRFRTPKYDLFIKNMMILLPKFEMPKKNIRLSIVFGFSSKSSDIDNCAKSFLDCLVKKYGVDDREIIELNIKKTIVKKGFEFIEFEILPYL